jgi:hypothetical protein
MLFNTLKNLIKGDMKYSRLFFVSLIIRLYFVVAFFPVLLKRETEYFPFFSFKLFSKIPDGFTRYDLVFDTGPGKSKYLLYNNRELNRLERSHFELWLQSAVKGFQQTGKLDLKPHEGLLEKGNNIRLVRMTRDYIEAVRDSLTVVEIIAVVK